MRARGTVGERPIGVTRFVLVTSIGQVIAA
jgi:hypothetical protein